MINRPELGTPVLGRFWLAEAEESTSLPGVMTLGPRGASLQIEGAVSGHSALQDRVIFGRLARQGDVLSLFNCFAGVTHFGADGPAESHIEASWVIFGCLTNALHSKGVEFRLPGSEEWFHEKTFSFDSPFTADEITVRFRGYEEWKYLVNDSLSLVRMYRSTVPGGAWGCERLEVTRRLVYRFVNETAVDYDALWRQIIRFRRLISFLSQSVLEQSDIGILAPDDGTGHSSVFAVHHSSFYPIEKGKSDWDKQLIRYSDVMSRFEDVLARWFAAYERCPEPFERYFSAFERGHFDSALYFLWIVAAVEELHKDRTTRDGMSLLERLKDLRDRWQGAMEPVPADDVLKEIKNSRHYYAHGAGDLRGSAARDWRLLRYVEFLTSIFNLEVLSLLGFDDAQIIATASSRYWMREALGLKTYPDPIA